MPTQNSPPLSPTSALTSQQLADLAINIKQLASEFGFADCGITDTDNESAGQRLEQWLDLGYHADMDYMSKHGSKRYRAAELVPGTKRIICLRMDYLDPKLTTLSTLEDAEQAYIARYALGRDYHKLVRKRLAQLSKAIETLIGPFGHRVFVDSAPVLEKPLAQKAGLGWQGKHTLLINRKQGSWFLLGEIFVDLALPIDPPYDKDHCSRCSSCMTVCPTSAFPEPYVLDANRCIAYLTIEHKGSIPLELRPLMGNRVFGCDDCQLACPWNRAPAATKEDDFKPRHGLDQAKLAALFMWTEAEFLTRTEGSPIRRAGFEGWQRNLAIGLGNGPATPATLHALQQQRSSATPMVMEHIDWALDQLRQRQAQIIPITPVPLAHHLGHKLKHLC
jgi:epoxyqueuosine reductase|tara:strand:+ start:10367 stop:11539 length:1173 start_codon:yes stop_codon:yes gene_type:complete